MSGGSSSPLEIRGFCAGYGSGERVVEEASFCLEPGSLTALVGPNGAGKSTLLKGILGLVPQHTSERVRFFGGDLDSARQRIAYLPQRAEIEWDFPATALDVVCMGLYARLGLFRRVGRVERERAGAALGEVGMAGSARMLVRELSGGQRQRVLIARTLVQGADLLLLDEPYANVDEATERTISAVLASRAAAGCTVLAVHHDLGSVRTNFRDAILFNRRVIAHGTAAAMLAGGLAGGLVARTYGIALDGTTSA